MKKILQVKDKPIQETTSAPDKKNILRKISEEVPIKDIKSKKIAKVLKEMSESLKGQSDGVAIAAPQIGYNLRIFVVSGKVFTDEFAQARGEKVESKEDKILSDDSPLVEPKEELPKDMVFINPKISKLSKDKAWIGEGCLSVRWLYGETYRSKKAMLTAYDENGKKFTRGASGLLAQIFQHEGDHLDGILFHDHARGLKEDKPQT